jgi:threonine dehydrogenase-like Zn-dependent dehydrogenase
MRAVVCHAGELTVDEVAEPRPARGQLVLQVTGCGICGSDLHARRYADAQADVLAEAGYDGLMRSDQHVVMGHEFTGEVIAAGPRTRGAPPVGTPVVAVPLRRNGADLHAIGLSEHAPGAYAQRVLVEASMTMAIPNGLPPRTAVLTEPMAIGYHAVRRSEIAKGDVAIVIGCGPVGLAVISMLKARGVRTVVASDFSPGRRALATTCGADVVVDPATESPYTGFADPGFLRTVPQAVGLLVGTTESLQKLPVPWHHVWRLAERLGRTPARPVVFECVGVPGILDGIITHAPLLTRVVVVGVCMKPDTIRPVMAINKEIDLRFVVGYTPLEFRDTLHLLADGTIDPTPLLTGTVSLDGVAGAFDDLTDPDRHAKIVIDPQLP